MGRRRLVTAREYADSLAIEPAAARGGPGFVRQWETLAYGGAGGAVPSAASSGGAVPLAAASSGRAPLQCRAPASAADPIDAEAFLARCLLITFRLT